MAAVAPAADQATELLQTLSLDSQNKPHEVPDAAKKPSGVPYGPVNNAEVASAPVPPPSDRSTTPVLPDFMDQTMCYVQNGYPSQAYYYGGYDGSVHDWEDYPRYDGMEGVYGDMYHGGYGYSPYGAYPSSPVPTMGHDGQLYGPQHYQYPGSYYQPSAPVGSGPAPAKPPTSQSDVSTSVAVDQPPISGDSLKANANGISNVNGSNGTVPAKSNLKNSSLTSNGTGGRGAPPAGVPSGYHDPRFAYDGIRSPVSWLDGPVFPDSHNRLQSANAIPPSLPHAGNVSSGRNQNARPYPHMGSHPQVPASGVSPVGPGFMNRMYPNNRLYGQYGNVLRNGQGFGSNGFGFQSNGRGWMTMDNKYKVRGRGNGFYGYGNENLEGLNELNKGPRSGRFKTNQKSPGSNAVLAVKGQNLPPYAGNEDSSLVPDKDQFNRAEFPVEYSDARFFVIKSYSEDDIHKSVKYSVWASTPNGNKKLDAAYREAKEKANACPIFLFFSVNTSGQFVGVAEMVGPVDFNKTVDYWQQDKWNGCFPVKWHIVKDVPNSILKHIILENNENKPVTNSRDTQEVKLDQGIQMIKLFKEHVSKSSILDDFGFYETRQKTMQERRAKQQFQKQVWDGKAAPASSDEKDKDGSNAKTRLQKPLEAATAVENAASTEPPKILKSPNEKRVVPNGVAENAATGC